MGEVPNVFDTNLAPGRAQAGRPGRFSAFDGPLGSRRQPTPVFEPGLAELSTATMIPATYAAMLHPADTRGVVVLAHRETYTRRDGTQGRKTGKRGRDRRRAPQGGGKSWSRSPSR